MQDYDLQTLAVRSGTHRSQFNEHSEAMYLTSSFVFTNAAEAAERFTENEHEPALQQFNLVVGALRALAHGTYDSSLILDAYLLRSLGVAGFAPSMTTCSKCDEPGPHKYFSLVGGGSVCATCKPSAAATPSVETLELMSNLMTGDWNNAVESDLRSRREASGLIAAYLQWHIERGLRSLPLVERI